MTIDEQISSFEHLFPGPRIRDTVARVLQISPEKEALAVLPSIQIGTDGFALGSILIVTASYICEARFTPAELDIDFASKFSIDNYRIRLWVHEIRSGEEVSARYDMAEIHLVHGKIRNTTTLAYAGHGREAWLSSVFEHLPVTLLHDRAPTDVSALMTAFAAGRDPVHPSSASVRRRLGE